MNLGLKHVNETQTRNLLILRVTPHTTISLSQNYTPNLHTHPKVTGRA